MKGTRKRVTRISAWLLALALMVSMVNVPAFTVQAASVEVSLNPNTSVQTVTASGNYEVRWDAPSGYSSMKAMADAGLTQLQIQYQVTACTASSEGTPGVMPFVSCSAVPWSNNNVWQNIQTGVTNTVTLDLSAVNTTDTSAATMGIQFANVTGSLTFQIVSAVLLGGDGAGGGNGGGSSDNTEDIVTDIEYNYAKLLQESLYLFDANMCGPDVAARSGLTWRSACHTCDQTASYNGTTVDVSGGFHDAGDHAKFGLPQAYAATVLGLSYVEFGEAFTELKLDGHFKRIMDHFVEYFKNCTILDGNGDVKAFCYQVGNGTTDHSFWDAPEKQGDRSSEALFTSGSQPGTDVVSETAAALAIYAYIYDDDEALSYAKKLFAYANSFSTKKCIDDALTTPFYASENWQDDYGLAAAWLYKVTGDSTYKTYYNNVYNSFKDIGWVMCWNNVAKLACMYHPDGAQWSSITGYMNSDIANKSVSSDNNYYLLNQWGSTRYNTAMQFVGLVHDAQKNTDSYSSWAKGQMNYLLGNNAGKHCFVVGYNSYSVKNPHHRAASGYTWDGYNNRATQAHVLVGALVGGPQTTSSAYSDDVQLFEMTEVALDFNTSLVGAAAGLYLYIKEHGTDEEKAVQETIAENAITTEIRVLGGAGVAGGGIGGDASEEDTSEEDTTEEETTEEELTPGKLTSDTAKYTFTTGKYNDASMESKNITIRNTGEASVTGVIASLNNSNFVITTHPANEVAGGTTTKIVVSPKQGLAPGSYTGVLTIQDGAGGNQITISLSYKVNKGIQTITCVPVVVSRTSNSITVREQDYKSGVEFAVVTKGSAIPASAWTTNTTITGLNSYIYYDVYARIAETSNYEAGAKSAAVTTFTYQADPYTINIGQISAVDCDYVQSFVDSETGQSTISVVKDGNSYTVTFTNPNKAYTITGSNLNVTVNTGSVKNLTLDRTMVNAIVDGDANADLTIHLNGNNTVRTITTAGTTVITSEQNEAGSYVGSVNVSTPTGAAITSTGSLEIAGGNVTLSGKSMAIDGEEVTISGGNVTASKTDRTDGSAVIQGDEYVHLYGGNITTNKPANCEADDFGTSDSGEIVVTDTVISGDPTYSKDPVDENGEILTTVTITFKDENGSVLKSATLNKGKTLNLAGAVVLQDGSLYENSKLGYTLTWTDGSNTYTTQVDVVNTDLELTAVWTFVGVSMQDVVAGAIANQTYTGAAIEPTLTLTYKGNALVKGVDYTAVYSNNVEPGTASVQVTGMGIYKDTITLTFIIVKEDVVDPDDDPVDPEEPGDDPVEPGDDPVDPEEPGDDPVDPEDDPIDIAGAAISGVTTQYYTGSAIKPAITVTYAGKKLVANTDYKVAYTNNTMIGTGKITVTGMGDYTGVVTKTFAITVKKGSTYRVGAYVYKIKMTKTNGKGTVELMQVAKQKKKVKIGATVKIGGASFKVVAIGNHAFKGNTKVRRVVIGDNVKQIGINAFSGCTNLKVVVVGKNVKKIGKNAFFNCKSMQNFTINTAKLKMKSVGAKAFAKMGAKNYKKLVVKVPAAKKKLYKKILIKKGLSKKAKIKAK